MINTAKGKKKLYTYLKVVRIRGFKNNYVSICLIHFIVH